MPEPEISRALGDAGAPFPMPVGEKVWYVSTLTKRRQSKLEMWLIEEAKKDAARDRQNLNLSDEVYASYLNKINRDVNGGYYRLGGEGYAAKMKTWDGQSMLLRVLLETKQPDVTDADIEDLMENHFPEVRSAIELVMGELQKRLGVDEHGNPLKPARTEPAPG